MSVRVSLLGRRFGSLRVISFSGRRSGHGHALWRCLCLCGNYAVVDGFSLRYGTTRSCGCRRRRVTAERNRSMNPARKTHGMSDTPEWSAFKSARYRCTNSNCSRWKDYGGRGIRFLFKTFQHFIDELGPRPSSKHSLDRYPNNDGDYAPGNVRWATSSEQRRNQRRVCTLTEIPTSELRRELKRRRA